MPVLKITRPSVICRRELLKALSVAPLIPSALFTAQSATPPTTQPPSAQTPPAPGPVADALTEVVRHRYGSRLSEEQLKEIKVSIAVKLRNSERLRSIKLLNSDEPEIYFRA